MRADAFAKVNISLRVRPPDRTGLHPIRSLMHSIDWCDQLELMAADEDDIVVEGDAPSDGTNLAVRALEAVRRRSGRRRPFRLHLTKQIPVAAGLGGGSADAAAVLGLAGEELDISTEALRELAPSLGADVPFCLVGGAAWVGGHGERIEPTHPRGDFALAVVVPPFPLGARAVYRRWDELGGPSGSELARHHLPDSLRDIAAPVNDLTAAAVDLKPDLADWMNELRTAWGVPVLMSGSGPALFGVFPALDEAAGATAAVAGARAARACIPSPTGWRRRPGGTLP